MALPALDLAALASRLNVEPRLTPPPIEPTIDELSRRHGVFRIQIPGDRPNHFFSAHRHAQENDGVFERFILFVSFRFKIILFYCFKILKQLY